MRPSCVTAHSIAMAVSIVACNATLPPAELPPGCFALEIGEWHGTPAGGEYPTHLELTEDEVVSGVAGYRLAVMHPAGVYRFPDAWWRLEESSGNIADSITVLFRAPLSEGADRLRLLRAPGGWRGVLEQLTDIVPQVQAMAPAVLTLDAQACEGS
jgi:hypothetical protein